MINIEDVITVDASRRQAERLRIGSKRARPPHLRKSRRHFPPIVFANQNQREPPRAGDVHGFVRSPDPKVPSPKNATLTASCLSSCIAKASPAASDRCPPIIVDPGMTPRSGQEL